MVNLYTLLNDNESYHAKYITYYEPAPSSQIVFSSSNKKMTVLGYGTLVVCNMHNHYVQIERMISICNFVHILIFHIKPNNIIFTSSLDTIYQGRILLHQHEKPIYFHNIPLDKPLKNLFSLRHQVHLCNKIIFLTINI